MWHAKIIVSQLFIPIYHLTKEISGKKRIHQRSICGFNWSDVFYKEIIRQACYAMWKKSICAAGFKYYDYSLNLDIRSSCCENTKDNRKKLGPPQKIEKR